MYNVILIWGLKKIYLPVECLSNIYLYLSIYLSSFTIRVHLQVQLMHFPPLQTIFSYYEATNECTCDTTVPVWEPHQLSTIRMHFFFPLWGAGWAGLFFLSSVPHTDIHHAIVSFTASYSPLAVWHCQTWAACWRRRRTGWWIWENGRDAGRRAGLASISSKCTSKNVHFIRISVTSASIVVSSLVLILCACGFSTGCWRAI